MKSVIDLHKSEIQTLTSSVNAVNTDKYFLKSCLCDFLSNLSKEVTDNSGFSWGIKSH